MHCSVLVISGRGQKAESQLAVFKETDCASCNDEQNRWDYCVIGWRDGLPLKRGNGNRSRAANVKLESLMPTWAFISKDGIWRDQGWEDSEAIEAEYSKAWCEMINALAPDDVLSIYDCHF